MMNRALVKRQDGLMPDANGLTVGAYLEEWLKHKAGKVQASTLHSYTNIIEWHLKPNIGRLRLDGLQPKHVDHLHKTLQAKKLAHRTLEYAHVILHGALAYAVRLEMLPRNVADAVKIPRRNGQKAEMRVWTTEQAAQFLEHARTHRLFGFFYTAITTGMRRGELLGLRWQDVDLEKRVLRVRSTLVEIRGQLSRSEPKTRASKRMIALSPDTVTVLLEHQQRQNLERESQGSRFWRC
jgi:integrase